MFVIRNITNAIFSRPFPMHLPTNHGLVEVEYGDERVFGVPGGGNDLHLVFVQPPPDEAIGQVCLQGPGRRK